jgi:hypothetical protein
MQPEPRVIAARTNPRDKDFIMQVLQAKASLRMLPTLSCIDNREKCSCLRPPLQACFEQSPHCV